ncbi:MAG: tetratricopeptide repeat protein, partial [Hyphomonadaceae bacterium]
LYRQALELDPASTQTLTLLGTIHLQRGAYEVGLTWIDTSLAQAPAQPIALNSRAAAFNQMGRFAEALRDAEQALTLKLDFAAAHTNRGDALRGIGRLQEALVSYQSAARVDPRYIPAFNNAGALLLMLGAPDSALGLYDHVARLFPDSADAHANRAAALLALRDFAGALAASERALSLKANHAQAHQNRAVALRDLGRFDESLAAFDAALAAAPRSAQAHNYRAALLERLERFDEAAKGYDNAAVLGDREAPLNMALLHLKRGNFTAGWRAYEARWSASRMPRRETGAPLWLGETPLQGKTLLLHAEQGFGDTIMFARYALLAKAQGARVLLEVQPPLASLMKSLDSGIEINSRGSPLPAHDLQTPLMSAPLAFRTTLETIPAKTPYLSADPAKVEASRTKLGERTRPRIGFVLSGGAGARNDHERSIDAAVFAPLFDLGAEFHCLQPDLRDADRAALASRANVTPHHPADFAETAALASCMDLIVTVDTATAHLAGALNLPMRIMLSKVADYRWLLDREDSPWHPSAKLYRQAQPNDWAPVIARIAQDIKALR